MDLRNQIAHYLRVCIRENFSTGTLKAYSIDLAQFAAFVGEAAVDKPLPQTIPQETAEALLQSG